MEQELLNSITAAISQSSSSSPSESLFFMNYQFDGRDSRSMQNYQDTMDRRHTAAVLSEYLDDSAKQAQALRQENVNLKKVNAELTTRLSLLIRAASEYEALGLSGSGLDSVMGGLTRMSLAGSGDCSWSDGAESSPSPTSVMDSGRVEGNADRVVLPKCISVRSTGFLKSGQAVAGSGGNSNAVGVGLRKLPGNSKISNEGQKVYVRGGKKEDQQALELQVYNQGMFKTELCNKWQETGACPYGDNCQFAHGIQELRPVLRHPRYKTEVCRMMLNGDHCPYGHRCHFRHSLTDQEKLVRSINLRAFKGLPF